MLKILHLTFIYRKQKTKTKKLKTLTILSKIFVSFIVYIRIVDYMSTFCTELS